MKLDKYLDLLKNMDYWIAQGNTGSAKEFAQRLNLSERMLYAYLSYLKDMGVPIAYQAEKRSYVYTHPGKLQVDFRFGRK